MRLSRRPTISSLVPKVVQWCFFNQADPSAAFASIDPFFLSKVALALSNADNLIEIELHNEIDGTDSARLYSAMDAEIAVCC